VGPPQHLAEVVAVDAGPQHGHVRQQPDGALQLGRVRLARNDATARSSSPVFARSTT
jgi:hypothetical protein